MRKAAEVLLVGPLSGGDLVGGIENGIDMLLGSPLAERHGIAFFNSYRPRDPDRPWRRRLAAEALASGRFLRTLIFLRPRVVHVKAAEGVNFLQGLGYVLLARLVGARVLLQIHGGSFDEWYGSMSAAGRLLVRTGLRLPSALIVLSEYWRSFVTGIGVRTQVHVVPNAVDLRPRQVSRVSAGTTFRVVTLGAIGERKGYFDILAAACLLRNEPIQFQFAGPDEFGGETDAIRRRIHEWGLEGRVELLGPVTGAQKWRLLMDADCFLFPSHHENMPNAVLEAMAVGLPIVCTDVGAIREMVDERGAAFVPVGDGHAIAVALRALRVDPARRESMGRANRDRVEVDYALERVLARLGRVYEEAVA